VAENQRGGRLGDGDERAVLGCGRMRQTVHGGEKDWLAAGGSF
jgi:hypothetical protein